MLAAAVVLMLQSQPAEDFRGTADRLSERLEWITGTIKDLGEKKRVHAAALAEVEAYLETIRRKGKDLQAVAKRLEEMQGNLAVKSKEHLELETEYGNEKKLYDQQFNRYDARDKDLTRRWAALDSEIKAHNARQNDVPQDQVEAYRQNAERLNGVKARLQTETDQANNVELPAVQAAYDKLERLRLKENAVEAVKIDLSNDLLWDGSEFRTSISSMAGPAEALQSLLLEATGKQAASTAFRIHATRGEATALTLAEAFGGGFDLPDTMLSDVHVLRTRGGRSTTREHIVERLRLGELIESIRALSPEASDKAVAADRAFEAPPAAASKPCALVQGAGWTMKPPERSALVPQRAPGLRGS